PRLDRKAVLVAIAVDRISLDVLHEEIGTAIRSRPAVEQPRDSVVIQSREDPLLAVKALQYFRSLDAGVRDLDRDLALELSVPALGEVDRTHPTSAEDASQHVLSDRSDRTRGRFQIEESTRFGKQFDQRARFLIERLVAPARFLEKGESRLRSQLRSAFQDFIDIRGQQRASVDRWIVGSARFSGEPCLQLPIEPGSSE